jgi:nicotinic acid phosphoribosyltransferase
MNKEVKEFKELLKPVNPERLDEYGLMIFKGINVLLDYINQLEEKIRISQEHPFLSKEAFEKLKKIKIQEDKEIEYLKGDYTLPVRPAKENEAFISGCLLVHEDKINELVKAVNELKKGK